MNDETEQQAPELKQEPQVKERDWFNRTKVAENGHGQSDVSGSSQSGERWAGRSFGGGRER